MKFLLVAGAAALALAACDQGATDQSAQAAPGQAAGAVKAAPPAGTNYLEQFAETPEGGVRIGNPNAPVKLVEYLSLTCPACARFSQEGTEPLRRYVERGDVSWEIRNYVLNGLDASAVLLARCGGPGPFFAITEQLYATQPEWIGRAQSNQAQIEAAPPNGVVAAYASAAGLDSFVRVRGVPAERAAQCLDDQAALQRIEANNRRASDEGVTGTPTFLVNGEKANVITWPELQPLIDAELK